MKNIEKAQQILTDCLKNTNPGLGRRKDDWKIDLVKSQIETAINLLNDPEGECNEQNPRKPGSKEITPVQRTGT
jgi:hypothetical protein